MGSTGSRLLSGNYPLANLLEQRIANDLNKEDALLFNSGYHANTGIVSALSTLPHTVFVADRLCHASMMDGLLLGKQPFSRFRHNDYTHLRQLVQQAIDKGAHHVVVLAESIYSMDGDSVDFAQLKLLKQEFPQIVLYIDEAHAIGVYGESGRGWAQQENAFNEVDILVGTFGKALAGMGAYVACSHTTKQFLINKARSFIFSTMLPPAVVAWNYYAWTHIPMWSDKRRALMQISNLLRSALKDKGYPLTSCSHIIPILVPGNHEVNSLSFKLNELGFPVRPIRYPTVPQGAERIRISLTAHIPTERITQLADALPLFHA